MPVHDVQCTFDLWMVKISGLASSTLCWVLVGKFMWLAAAGFITDNLVACCSFCCPTNSICLQKNMQYGWV